jgi:AraC-like DNA-binding protein
MANTQTSNARTEATVERVLQHIEQHLAQPLTLSDLSQIAGLSVWRFATVFRQRVGMAPHRYICRLRVQRAEALMLNGTSAATAASEAGFYDQSHLSRHFKSVFGMAPGRYVSTPREPGTPTC